MANIASDPAVYARRSSATWIANSGSRQTYPPLGHALAALESANATMKETWVNFSPTLHWDTPRPPTSPRRYQACVD